LKRERAGHLLQTTALVNETYLNLVDARRVTWRDRVHFFAISARLMREILVHYARGRDSQKRAAVSGRSRSTSQPCARRLRTPTCSTSMMP
jgi:hypothetical protein